ncbi:hypothetical protein Tco_1021865 [Tanacetum coccineum]
MSPYLFTLVMEVFSLIMEKNIEESNGFGYHFGCKELKLSHICFVDDLLALYKGNRDSIEVIKKSQEEFNKVSGRVPNLSKSIIFFGSINERDKSDPLQVLPFKCGTPVKMNLDVVDSMVGRCGKNNIGNVVDKLILAASMYFIWQERNFRLFKNESRSEDVLINIIYDSVRSKLMTVIVKKTSRTDVIAKKWNLQWNNQYLSDA